MITAIDRTVLNHQQEKAQKEIEEADMEVFNLEEELITLNVRALKDPGAKKEADEKKARIEDLKAGIRGNEYLIETIAAKLVDSQLGITSK